PPRSGSTSSALRSSQEAYLLLPSDDRAGCQIFPFGNALLWAAYSSPPHSRAFPGCRQLMDYLFGSYRPTRTPPSTIDSVGSPVSMSPDRWTAGGDVFRRLGASEWSTIWLSPISCSGARLILAFSSLL